MIPRATQNTVAITLLADFTVFAFFVVRSPSKTYCFDCSFVSGVQWCVHVSSTVMYQRRTSSGLRRKSAKIAWESTTWLRLFSSESKHGTHLAEILFTPNFSNKIENTVPCDMHMASTISRTLIRRSFKTISWILSIISGVVTSTGRHERFLYFMDVQPRLNSFTQL